MAKPGKHVKLIIVELPVYYHVYVTRNRLYIILHQPEQAKNCATAIALQSLEFISNTYSYICKIFYEITYECK